MIRFIIALLLLLVCSSPADARGGSGRGVGRGTGPGPARGTNTGPVTKPSNKPSVKQIKNATDYIEQVFRENSDSNRSDFLWSQRDKSLTTQNEQIKDQKKD